MSVQISVIIVTYNSGLHIGKLLDSITKTSSKLSLEIIVVDNASKDNTVTVVSSHPLRPLLIRSRQNLGFARAVNLGIRQSHGEFVILINPDTLVVGNALGQLYQYAQMQKNLGAIAPRLFDINGNPQASIFHFPSISGAIAHYFFGIKRAYGKYLPAGRHGLPAGRLQTVDVAVMAAFMIPRRVLSQVGLLDEKYFLYYEDIDFCRRLKKAGLSVYYCPQAKVRHIHGGSSSHAPVTQLLVNSSILYHGTLYYRGLTATLWLGQKWRQILSRFH